MRTKGGGNGRGVGCRDGARCLEHPIQLDARACKHVGAAQVGARLQDPKVAEAAPLHEGGLEVIRGHQRSSEVIRGHQRSSEVIRGHQRSSVVITCTRAGSSFQLASASAGAALPAGVGLGGTANGLSPLAPFHFSSA